MDLSTNYDQQGIKIRVWQKEEEKDRRGDCRSLTATENMLLQIEVDALFVKLIQDITANRDETLASPTEAVIRSSTAVHGSEGKFLELGDAIGSRFTAIEKAMALEMTSLRRLIIVTPNKTETQKVLHALS